MKATINKDEKSVTTEEGNVYKIAGLVIKKPNGLPDVFYDKTTTLCKAYVFKGLSVHIKYVGDNECHLL